MATKNNLDNLSEIIRGTSARTLSGASLQNLIIHPFVSDGELIELYMKCSLAKRIINIPAEEALKNWFKITGDEENNVLDELDSLDSEKALAEAMIWENLFGQSTIFMLIDDGQTQEDPLDYDRINKVIELQVYDRREINIASWMFNDDPTSQLFGKPEWYEITPSQGGIPFYAHNSRLLLFNGEPLPNQERQARNGAGLPLLQGIIDDIARAEVGHERALDMLERASQAVIKFGNLLQVLSADGGDEMVKKRMEAIDLARNVMNSIALDSEDDFQVFNVGLANINNLLDSFCQYICAKTGIPFTVLFGRSPGGLNSTGQSDLEDFYSSIKRVQRRRLRPNLEKLVKAIMHSKDSLCKGKEPEHWKIEFNPLWIPTAEEEAKTNLLNNQADKADADALTALIDNQSLDISEARKYIADKQKYPIDDSLDNLSDDDFKKKMLDKEKQKKIPDGLKKGKE